MKCFLLATIPSLLICCGGAGKKAAQQPTWSADKPAFGLYRANKEKALAEIVPKVRALGQSEKAIAKERAEIERGDLWLVFDSELDVILFHTFETEVDGEQIYFDRGLNGFSLGERGEEAMAKCKASNSDAFSCHVDAGNGLTFSVTFDRETKMMPGLPKPGVYAYQWEPMFPEAFKAGLETNSSPEEAESAMKFLTTGSRRLFVVGSDYMLFRPMSFGTNKFFEFERTVGKLRPESGGFSLGWRDLELPSEKCVINGTGFSCELAKTQTQYQFRY